MSGLDIEKIRRDFPALERYTWFQNGGVSITPRPVADAYADLMQELLEHGPVHIIYPDMEWPRRARSMERIARFFSVEKDELALMRGVSEAYQTVLRGLEWRAGDQIILTADEEAALLLPALHLRDLFGVEVIRMPLIPDTEQQVEALKNCMTERTKLVALSHVGTDIGFRIPAKELCDAARESGIMTFLDLAHSAGLYPMPLRELGCDFAGILSYKWMYAPYSAGVLFIRKERLHDIQVTYAGGRSEKSLDFDHDTYEMHETAQRFEYGPWPWPLVHAWARALDYLDEYGLENIWRRTVSLCNRLKDGLKNIPGARLLTPESPDFSAALVTFELAGWKGKELVKALRDRWNIIIKNPAPDSMECLRTSIAFFLLEQEIDTLLEALNTLSHEK
ncbi:MAG: aminotransferase class V-fold PLP-dependent enzyme [Planctomycetota bacterium]|nr:aminotransferase class V-fold PLP-dependent enzyme [Planctomycetota bacterium]MDA1137039.1 aminotransferase class V-fold PLP-dependent enzyme [Planctomycetota bacterium]